MTAGEQLTFVAATTVEPPPWRRATIDPARVRGIETVESHTPEQWRAAFDEAVERIPEGQTFHVYDVLDVVGKPEGVHPSAIGARMRRASHAGLVVKVGHADRASHGDVVTLWRRVGAS